MPQPRKSPPRETLTPKEEQFAAEYLIDKDASNAARRSGYSSRTSRQIGYQLLQKPHVKAAIAKALKAQQTRALITADMVLKRIDRVAEKAEGKGDFAAANQANKLLGMHYKLFTEKHEHGGIGGGPVVLQVTTADENL